MKNIEHNPNAKPTPVNKDDAVHYHYGRGAQFNTKNKFLINETTKEHTEAIDDWEEKTLPTQSSQRTQRFSTQRSKGTENKSISSSSLSATLFLHKKLLI